jgi:hypothetical protein
MGSAMGTPRAEQDVRAAAVALAAEVTPAEAASLTANGTAAAGFVALQVSKEEGPEAATAAIAAAARGIGTAADLAAAAARHFFLAPTCLAHAGEQ